MKKLFLLFIILFTVSCSKKDERPNILFIMSDDHAYQAISSYSNKLINTPNIWIIRHTQKVFMDIITLKI